MKSELPEVLHDADAEAEGDEVDQVGVEVVAGVGEEGRRDQVDERRAEVGAELLAEQCHEARASLAARCDERARRGPRASASPSRTSSSVQPRPTTSAGEPRAAPARPAGRGRTKTSPARAVRGRRARRRSTPGSAASARRAPRSRGPSTRTMSALRALERAARGPPACPRPPAGRRARMTMREQSAPPRTGCGSRAGRCGRRARAAASRISTVCTGSSPTVGSSRTSTAGSPSSACARPTRWR